MAALTRPAGTIRTPQRAHLAGKPLVRTSTLRPPVPRRRAAVPVAFQAQEPSEVTKIEEWRVKRMTDAVHEYFDTMLSKGRVDLVTKLLDPNVQHKDMVRDEARSGHDPYITYLKDVHNTYPNFWARAVQVGVADDHTVFVSFEGQATEHTPMFNGIDRIVFNHDLSKIVEVEIYRSNWQGAKGHEQRKQERAKSHK